MRQGRFLILSTIAALPLSLLVACNGSGGSDDPDTQGANLDPDSSSNVQQGGQFETACSADPVQTVTGFVPVEITLPGAPEDVPVLDDVIAGDTLPEIPVLAGVIEGDTSGLTAEAALALLEGTPLGTLPVVAEIRAVCGETPGSLEGIDPTTVIGLIPLFDDADPSAVVGLVLVTVESTTGGDITGVELPETGTELDAILADVAGALQGVITQLLGLLVL